MSYADNTLSVETIIKIRASLLDAKASRGLLDAWQTKCLKQLEMQLQIRKIKL